MRVDLQGGLFAPVLPRLVEMTPQKPIHLGVHCQGFSAFEAIRRGKLPVTLIEVKPEYFAGKDRLFRLEGERYQICKDNFDRLVAEARELGLAIQFHFPETLEGVELNPGIPGHHPLIISLFRAIAGVVAEYDLTPNVTMHLPTLFWRERRIIANTPEAIAEALKNANELLGRLAVEHRDGNWPIVLGLENTAGPTAMTHGLGYRIEHFETAMAGTPPWINFTIDAGHRIISKNLTIAGHVLPLAHRLGKRVINIHFHENQGVQSDTYHGDEHNVPVGGRIHGYLNYLRRAVQERIPIVLEVKMDNLVQLLVVASGIRALMEKMDAERLEPEDTQKALA